MQTTTYTPTDIRNEAIAIAAADAAELFQKRSTPVRVKWQIRISDAGTTLNVNYGLRGHFGVEFETSVRL